MNNKEKICNVNGALRFFVSLLETSSGTSNKSDIAIEEVVSGLLRSLSVYFAMHDHIRNRLRGLNFYKILLYRSLSSGNMNVVANACGILWSMSARCSKDQYLFFTLGAEARLKALTHSTNKLISMTSMATLKNLYSSHSITSSAISSMTNSLLIPPHSPTFTVASSCSSSISNTFMPSPSSENSLDLSVSSSSSRLSSSASSSFSYYSNPPMLANRSRKQMFESSQDFIKKVEKSSISRRFEIFSLIIP